MKLIRFMAVLAIILILSENRAIASDAPPVIMPGKNRFNDATIDARLKEETPEVQNACKKFIEHSRHWGKKENSPHHNIWNRWEGTRALEACYKQIGSSYTDQLKREINEAVQRKIKAESDIVQGKALQKKSDELYKEADKVKYSGTDESLKLREKGELNIEDGEGKKRQADVLFREGKTVEARELRRKGDLQIEEGKSEIRQAESLQRETNLKVTQLEKEAEKAQKDGKELEENGDGTLKKENAFITERTESSKQKRLSIEGAICPGGAERWNAKGELIKAKCDVYDPAQEL